MRKIHVRREFLSCFGYYVNSQKNIAHNVQVFVLSDDKAKTLITSCRKISYVICHALVKI